MAKTKTTATKGALEKNPFIYVGVTIFGVATQNRIYSDMPEALLKLIQKVPEISNLCIPIRDYTEAERMIREKQGYIYSAYKKSVEIKGGNR